MKNDAQFDIVQEAIKFADEEIRPYASDFDERGEIPRALITEMANRGYLAAPFPKAYGGLDLNPLSYGLFTEAIGKACASTRAMITVHTSLVGETILRCGNEEQKFRFLPAMATGETLAAFALTEPDVGTDAKSIKTTYRREGDYYVINGTKKWITLGAIADLFLVIASDNGKVSAFLVERNTEGVYTSPLKGLLASRAAHLAEVGFNDVFVPSKNRLGREGSGFVYIANTALDFGRYSIAWGGLGIAQEALEAMITYSRNRKQFGKSIHTFQLVQGIIGDAVCKMAAARALCTHAGELRNTGHSDATMETLIAKYFVSKVANQVAYDSLQIHGGNGCSNRYPVERLFREARILEIIEGTSQVLQEVMAEYGLQKFHISKNVAVAS